MTIILFMVFNSFSSFSSFLFYWLLYTEYKAIGDSCCECQVLSQVTLVVKALQAHWLE